jgi:hypothetical protein
LGESVRHYLKNKLKKQKDWGNGSSGRALAYKAPGGELDSQYYKTSTQKNPSNVVIKEGCFRKRSSKMSLEPQINLWSDECFLGWEI